MGARVKNLDHTAWQLVYHIHIAQKDILEYIRNPEHVSPDYPHGYWPDEDGPADVKEWYEKIEDKRQTLKNLRIWYPIRE
ncbi:MAG: hypothetical protein DRP87_06705 [Spirochaetes bacterium]|nr:MAG: hypothetical protein DRP87_06705 [Spirochaetota bacterium]